MSKNIIKNIGLISFLILLSDCQFENHKINNKPDSAKIIPVATKVTAGIYNLDRAHASLIFKINHLGLSHYTARFKNFNAQLQLNPSDPEASQVTATIDPASIETDFPDPKLDFNAQLQNADWLSGVKFPKITFHSTKIKLTSPNTAQIDGVLDLHGITKLVTLNATFNGGYAGYLIGPQGPRIGFSAHGALKRSDFGITKGLPFPGSNIGVGDEVEFIIEAEFVPFVPAGFDNVN